VRVEFVWNNWGGPLGMSQGVSMLSSELADAGHDVDVVHFHEALPGPQSPEQCAELLSARAPDAVMFSFGTNQAAVTRKIADAFKRLSPRTPTLAGGVHCTLTPEEPLGWGSIDYVFVGEADGHMDRLVTKLGRGESIEDEPNIGCQRDGAFKRTKLAPLPSVARQPRPYWEGIDYRDLCIRMRGLVDVLAGRGCPYRCKYCHNAGLIELYRSDMKLPVSQLGFTRSRLARNLLDECIRYKQICGEHLKMFVWGDDMAVMSKPFLREWAEIYPRAIPDVPFALNATLNFLDDEVVALLAQANCALLKFGLESGSARLRKFMQRPDHREQVVISALERLRRHGINSRAYVMVGMPTETKAELLSTFDEAARLRIDTVRPSIFFPYPGTPAHEYCVENDLIDSEVLAGVHNYYTRSVLRGFDAEMHRLISRIMEVFPIVMNAAMGGEVGASYAPLKDRALSAPEDEWDGGLRAEALADQQALNARFRRTGAEFYAVPFPDRPDASFLTRRRVRPLPNIDDTPNPEIDAA
jgi:anaerobic magnesium-protoporphyrin IX monomethyl ester cyclase